MAAKRRMCAASTLDRIFDDDDEDVDGSDYGRSSEFESESDDDVFDEHDTEDMEDDSESDSSLHSGSSTMDINDQQPVSLAGPVIAPRPPLFPGVAAPPPVPNPHAISDSDTDSDSGSTRSSVIVPATLLRGRGRGRGRGTIRATNTGNVRGRGLGRRGRARGRGRGRGRGRANVRPRGRQAAAVNVQWTNNTQGFTELHFQPNEQPGPKNIPAIINEDSTPLEYFELYWDDDLWQILVTETNRNAARLKAAKPNSYVAKSFVDVSVAEMKAFFGCRITMEMLIHKDRYAQYWRNHDNLLTETPGFAKVMSRDSFLAIWSLLHCVNEDDPDLDKTDKIYKSRPVFTYILENFKRCYVPSGVTYPAVNYRWTRE